MTRRSNTFEGPPFKVTGYFGVSMEVLQSTYLHHHPDHLRSVVRRGMGEK
jgi:hypothetical protein